MGKILNKIFTAFMLKSGNWIFCVTSLVGVVNETDVMDLRLASLL